MAEVVPANVSFPDLPSDGYIEVKNGIVQFKDFAVDSAAPVKRHLDFIAGSVAPFLIRQIEQLGFEGKTATLHLYGFTSATGTQAHNQALSEARAAAIGAAIRTEFDRQKQQGRFSRSYTVVPDPHGLGFAAGKAYLAQQEAANHTKYSSAQIEAAEGDFRAVWIKMTAQHDVIDDDKTVLGRQVFGCKFKEEKVPLDLLDQTIEDLKKNAGAWLGAGLTAAFSVFTGQLKSELKKLIKQCLEDADFAAPEIAIIFESVDFIVPSDVTQGFQFKDSRGRKAVYKFTGSQNSKNFTLFDLLSKLIGLNKWLEKVDKAVDRLIAKVPAGTKLQELFKVKEVVKKLLDAGKKNLHTLIDPGGTLRPMLGDGLCELLLNLLSGVTGTVLTTASSDWAKVEFAHPGVFDVATFSGPARTETHEQLGKAQVELEFIGAGPEGRLGFNAHVTIQNAFNLSTGLIGLGLANGKLIVQPDLNVN